MKRLTRDLVVPIISARVFCLMLGLIGVGLSCKTALSKELNVNFPIVTDQPQFSKLVHEETHAQSGRTDHLP
jgi:hypothetical protein